MVENIVGKKEKMLVISIFSFSHNVFKRLFFFTGSVFFKGLCGKELNAWNGNKRWTFNISNLEAYKCIILYIVRQNAFRQFDKISVQNISIVLVVDFTLYFTVQYKTYFLYWLSTYPISFQLCGWMRGLSLSLQTVWDMNKRINWNRLRPLNFLHRWYVQSYGKNEMQIVENMILFVYCMHYIKYRYMCLLIYIFCHRLHFFL